MGGQYGALEERVAHVSIAPERTHPPRWSEIVGLGCEIAAKTIQNLPFWLIWGGFGRDLVSQPYDFAPTRRICSFVCDGHGGPLGSTPGAIRMHF